MPGMVYGTVYGLYDSGGLRYIGQTVDALPKRLGAHWVQKGEDRKCRWIAKLKREGSPRPAIREFGTAADDDALDHLEIFHIAHARASNSRLTNTLLGGHLGRRGVKASPETRARISAGKMGKKPNLAPEQRAAARARMVGNKFAEGGSGNGGALRGIPLSPAHRANIGAGLRCRPQRHCTVPGCSAKHLAKGLCVKHYNRTRRPPKPKEKKACSVAGCAARFYARGYCSKHYQAFCKTRPVRVPKPPRAPRSTCTIPGCSGPNKGLGLCSKHYQQHKKTAQAPTFCSVPGCGRKHYTRGLCATHDTNGAEYVICAPKPVRFCGIPSCGRKHTAQGLCSKHYRRRRKGRLLPY